MSSAARALRSCSRAVGLIQFGSASSGWLLRPDSSTGPGPGPWWSWVSSLGESACRERSPWADVKRLRRATTQTEICCHPAGFVHGDRDY